MRQPNAASSRAAAGPPILCPAAEAVTLQFLDVLTQPLVLGALGGEHRLKRDRIVGQWLGWIAHKADSIMDYKALPVSWPPMESTCRGRCARLAGIMHPPPIQPFQERLQLRCRQPHHTVGDGRPAELSVFQTLRQQAHAGAVASLTRSARLFLNT